VIHRGVLLAAAALATVFVETVPAQPPEFEAASVKPNSSGERRSGTSTSRGQTRLDNISWAPCSNWRSTSAITRSPARPGWIPNGSTSWPRFPLREPGAGPGHAPGASQEPFRIGVPLGTKQISGYALVAAVKGVKIRPVESTGESSNSTGDGMIQVRQISMEGLPACWRKLSTGPCRI